MTTNIAHILPWPSIGGTEHATLRLAQAVGRSYKSKIFYLGGATPVRDMFAHAGFETIAYEPTTPSYRHLKKFMHDSYALSKEFRRREIGIVHCSDILAGYYAAVAGRMANLPVLCHVRNRYEEIPRREANFLRAVNKFIFVSQDTWRRFAHRVPARRGNVVYDGIDIWTHAGDPRVAREAKQAVLAEFGLPERTRLVGMVARVAPQKDYETLAKAAARIIAAHPDVRFLIVGDNSLEEVHREHYRRVRQTLAENGVDPFFVFTGFREDVPRMVSAMDVFVLSTHFEGFPLVILEALAQGKPVVTTAVDGIPEIVHDGKTGLLFPHGDDVRLAAQVTSLLDADGPAAALGEAGREFVGANFTIERFATNMMNVYDEVVHIKSRSATIRTAPSAAKKSCPKLKILWLAHLDYRLGIAQGGNLRLFNYGKQLVSSGHEVYIVVMKRQTDEGTEREECLGELKRQKIITGYFEIEYHHPMVRGKLAHLLFHPKLTNLVLRKQHAPVVDAIRGIIRSKEINLCISSSRDLLFVLPEIQKEVKTIVDWVDSYFLHHLREAQLHLKEYRPIQAIKSLRYLADSFFEERYYGNQCASNLAVSPVDKKYLDFANGLPHKNRVLLNGVEAQRAEACVKVKNRIIFTGNMDFPPNYRSAIWFIDKVFPLLRARSDIKLVIAGANPVDELVARASDRIEVTGYVKDLRREIARSELYVAPLICGGGFKNKVVEAISSGTFVVATSMAVEFFDPKVRKHLLITDTPQQMADAILSYLQNPQDFAMKLKTLKRIIDEDFTWESKAKELVAMACEENASLRGAASGSV